MDLSRNIILEIDLDTGRISTTANNYFYNTDRNIAYFYIKLYRTNIVGEKQYISDTNSSQYKVYITTIKPKTISPVKLLGERVTNSDIDDNVIYKITIPNELMKQQGFVYCEGQVIYNNQELTTDCFSFKVNPDKLTEYNLTLITDPDLPVLQDMINQVKQLKLDARGIDDSTVSDEKTWSSENINTKFTGVNSQIKESTKQIYHIRKRNDDELDDNAVIKEAILNSSKNTKIYFNRDVVITEKIAISDRIIDGGNNTFVCGKEGLDYQFSASGYVKITNCKVDSKLIGRGFVIVNDSDLFIADNISFTGYSKEYGYYKTDAGICVNNNVKKVDIKNCVWEQWGNQYDNETSNLNRCITINDNVNDTVIQNCSFITVNQGIVNAGNTINVLNNTFENCNDNGLYLFGENAYIQNNVFTDMNDEPIVIKGGNYFISNNTFNNWSNKAVAFCGNTKFVNISNNIFLSNIDNSQFVITRDTSYNIEKVFIENNMFRCDFAVTNTYDWFTIGRCTELKFNNNNMYLNHTDANKKILVSNATILQLFNNSITCVQAPGTSVVNNGKNGNVIHGNNYLNNCRINLGGNKMGTAQANVPYYLGTNMNKFVYCAQKPTWENSNFLKGDIIINTTIDTDTKNGDVMGWYYNGSELNPLPMIPQNYNGNPNNNKRPRYIGDICIDTTNKYIYISTSKEINDWIKINNS